MLRGAPGSPDDAGVIGTLLRADELGLGRGSPPDAGSNPSCGVRQSSRRAFGRQAAAAASATTNSGSSSARARTGRTSPPATRPLASNRRVRIYPYARAATPEARDRLARTAQREFRVLEGVEHAGIQRVLDYREAELGPALVFEHDPNAAPPRSLSWPEAREPRPRSAPGSHPSARRGDGLRPRQAPLSPRPRASEHPCARPRERHAAPADHELAGGEPRRRNERRRSDDGRYACTSRTTSLTLPRFISRPRPPRAGMKAPHGPTFFPSARLPTISSPAARPWPTRSTCPSRLREGNGLLLSGAMNGAGRWLEEMVRAATAPVVRDRPRDAREFLDYLAEAEKEALPPEPAPRPPSIRRRAGPGDRLDGDLIVKRRLGRGGSADVLLVEREERRRRTGAQGCARRRSRRPDSRRGGRSSSPPPSEHRSLRRRDHDLRSPGHPHGAGRRKNSRPVDPWRRPALARPHASLRRASSVGHRVP